MLGQAVPEETRCNYAFYQEVLAFEVQQGLYETQLACKNQLDALKRQPFGPPSQWELFNGVCKRACRSYTDRIQRLAVSTDCECSKFNPPACPKTAIDLLCKIVEFCYVSTVYQNTFCADIACGRQATNEDSWRQC